MKVFMVAIALVFVTTFTASAAGPRYYTQSNRVGGLCK